MSLTKSFFDKRGKVIDDYKTQGYISIEEFEEKYSIKTNNIFQAGFLKHRNIKSTTDLYDYHVSSKGREFMKEIKEFELILIKPNSAINLANEIRN